MKPSHLAWRAEAAVARAALAVLRRLGPEAASNLGGWTARTLGPWLPVSRVAHENLRRAMPELDARARRDVVRGVWDNLGRTVAELPHVPTLRPTESGPGWELRDAGGVLPLLAAGGPAVLIGGHLANWEIWSRVASQQGIALAPFYRPVRNPYIDRLLHDLRQQTRDRPGPAFAKGAEGARAALAYLRAGGVVGLLVDQKMNDGIEARLFGMPAMTASAAAAFALRFRCPLIPANAERLGPARFRVVWDPPLPLPDTGQRMADIAVLTQLINDRLETWIRARPAEWLWLHRRWPKAA